MKTAILSVLFCRYPLDRTLEAVARIGYDGIDLYGGRPHAYPWDMDDERIAEVLRLKEKHRLEIPMYTPETLAYPYNIPSPYKQERQETFEYLSKAIDVAAKLEVPRIQITCGHAGNNTTRGENYARIYEVLAPLVEQAEKKRVTIILEALTVMESNTVVFADDLVEVLRHIDSPNLKTMMDTVTPMANREAFADHFEKLGDNIDYIHLVDSDGVSEAHLPLGQGIIDLPALMDTLRRYGYDGWLCIEIIRHYIMQPENYAEKEYRSLRALIDLK